MQLKHLKSFMAVAQSLHFRGAALTLGVTQPALSQHVAQLERDVGARLFDRDRRRVELTAAGETLLTGARAALVRLEEAAAAARALGEARENTLVIGHVEYVSQAYMPQAMSALKAVFPRGVVETRDMSPDEALQAVRDGSIDLGFSLGFGPDGLGDQTPDDRLVVRKVRHGHFRLVMARKHPLASLASVPLSALAGQDLILFQRRINPAPYDWLISHCEKAGFTARVAHHVSQPQHGPAMAAQGVGVFIVGSYVLGVLPRNTVSRPLTGFPTDITILAAWRPGTRAPLLKAFLSGLPAVEP